MRPLADEIRPQTLDDVAGQKHLLGEGALLRRLIENGTDANLIFYGPSGTGKTTVANIIARQAKKALYTLNATTASLQDVKNVMADVDTMMAPNGILLYLDEIQYFNKKQQQSLLEFLENGKITLIASTTENPYFYIYNALLSRSTVFEFKPLSVEDTIPAVERGLRIEQERSQLPFTWEEDVPRTVAAGCGGDVRKAINAVELLYRSAKPKDGGLYVTRDDALQLSQCSAMRYDREGDDHYDLLSALHKSMRNRELIQMLRLSKSLVYFSTSLKANEVILEKIMRSHNILKYEEDSDLLEDVIIENKQAIEMAGIYMEILSGTMDAFASLVSNNLNIVTKFLASMTIVMAIPSIFSGFWGMNFASMPFLNNPWGFYIVLGISLVATAVVTAIFWKKKMF